MIRKLAIALSLLGACFTGFVHALGLGEVTVKSALNQPLKAEIELVNTAGLTINEILPGLASREEFQRASVDRVYFLSDLRFEVITSPQGKAIIVLTSKKPVREPFLNFIVELIWPSGRLLREYALLIDPPLFSDQPVAKVSSPSVRQSSGDTLSVPSSTSSSNTRPLLAPVEKIQTNTYGATNSSDTLWDIAIKARPNRNVSPQQVMLAIQDLNPDAFIDSNINKLKAGKVLRLPTVEQIEQRSQYQAIIGVIAQNEALSGKRTPSVVQGSKEQTKNNNQVEPKAPSQETRVSNDELKLVVSDDKASLTANSANSGQSNQSGSGAANELAITLEKLDKTSIENKELNSRVGDLEEQLSTLQRLLTLKNDQLASIQTQMRTNELEKLKGQEELSTDAKLALQEATDPSTNEVFSETTANEDEITDSSNVALTESVDSQTLAEVNETAGSDNVASESEEAVAEADVVAEKSVSTKAPPSKNMIETIINNPIYLSISLTFVLILVFILWMVSRYNAKREEEFQSQSIYESDSADPDESPDDSDDEFDAQPLSSLDEDDFESSEELDGFAEDTDEESQDVLAEVEAYISYGRLDQAAQVLEKSISGEPVRTDYRLKLLEIYKDLGDRQAFDRQFSELEAIQDSDAINAADAIKADMLEEDGLQFDVNSDDISTAYDGKDDDEQSDVTADLDEEPSDEIDESLKSFDFDSVSLEDEAEGADLEVDLDLDDLDLDTESLDSNSGSDLSEASDEALEENDSLGLDEQVSEADTNAESDFDDSILDVELEDLDLSAELEQESEIPLEQDAQTSQGLTETTGEALVVSDDILEEATQAFEEDVAVSSLDEDLSDGEEFDFLSGTDEVSTKLDLARAYIDMGDIDGAKDILLEVTKEGSDAQQLEAKELIDSID